MSWFPPFVIFYNYVLNYSRRTWFHVSLQSFSVLFTKVTHWRIRKKRRGAFQLYWMKLKCRTQPAVQTHQQVHFELQIWALVIFLPFFLFFRRHRMIRHHLAFLAFLLFLFSLVRLIASGMTEYQCFVVCACLRVAKTFHSHLQSPFAPLTLILFHFIIIFFFINILERRDSGRS